MSPSKKQSGLPLIRVAPLGELNVYPVYEHELDVLGRGSPASLFLNFALALLPTAAGIAVTLRTSTTSDLSFVVLTCVAVIFALAGLLCLLIWWRMHVATRQLLQEIKSRMPPPQGVQQQPGNPPAAPGT